MIFRKEKVEGKFLKIAQEHEIVFEYIEKLKALLNSKDLSYSYKNLQSLLPTFNADMRHHFKIEERFLFPAALLSMPSIELVDLIMVLQKEHGFVERDILILEGLVHDAASEAELNESILELLNTLINDIEKHANIEMDHLFPKMDEDKKCQKIISGILLEPS